MKQIETHPSVDELAAYQAGALGAADEARLQDHLMDCADCTRALLDLDALRQGADPEEEAPEDEKDDFWESLRPRLLATGGSEEAEKPAVLPAPLPFVARQEPAERPPRPMRFLQLLAAVLTAAVVGLGLQNASLRRTVDDLSRPVVSAPVRDLSATATREAGAPAVITLAPHDHSFTLILSPADPRSFPDHELVLEAADGTEIWRGRGLRKNELGTFSVILTRRMVPAGDYTLRVFGVEGPAKQNLGEYHLRIETQ